MRYLVKIGAEEETRTPTGLRPPDPEPGASTSSATSAPINLRSIASTGTRVKGENAMVERIENCGVLKSGNRSPRGIRNKPPRHKDTKKNENCLLISSCLRVLYVAPSTTFFPAP